eukprot:6195223-Pleurochrysis_carterae.AAC.4
MNLLASPLAACCECRLACSSCRSLRLRDAVCSSWCCLAQPRVAASMSQGEEYRDEGDVSWIL